MPTITTRVPLAGISTGEAKIQVEADGYQGTACQDATSPLLAALGGAQDEQIKPEMFAENQGYDEISGG